MKKAILVLAMVLFFCVSVNALSYGGQTYLPDTNFTENQIRAIDIDQIGWDFVHIGNSWSKNNEYAYIWFFYDTIRKVYPDRYATVKRELFITRIWVMDWLVCLEDDTAENCRQSVVRDKVVEEAKRKRTYETNFIRNTFQPSRSQPDWSQIDWRDIFN